PELLRAIVFRHTGIACGGNASLPNRMTPVLKRGVNRSLRIVGFELRRVARPDPLDRLLHRNARDAARMRTVLAALLGSSSCCVDGGATLGDITQWMVHFAPEGDHLAIEPIPDLARDLSRRLPAVDVRCVALGERAARAEFNYYPSAHALSGL